MSVAECVVCLGPGKAVVLAGCGHVLCRVCAGAYVRQALHDRCGHCEECTGLTEFIH